MGANQSKEIPRTSPLGCILSHWKELVGYGGTENKKALIKFCTQWWPLYKLEGNVKWPPTGTLDYETLLQFMLFLRREHKWEEVIYAHLFFSLLNLPEWQRDCGIGAPSDPLVLALEKDKAKKEKLKQCCSTCSINQHCTHPDKVYPVDTQEQELGDLFRLPPRRQRGLGGEAAPIPTAPSTSFSGEGPTPISISPPAPISISTPAHTLTKAITAFTPVPATSTAKSTLISAPTSTSIPPLTFTPESIPLPSSDSEKEELLSPRGPVASRAQKQTKKIIQAPLREGVVSERRKMLVKIPFSTPYLEAWEKIAKQYRNDPIRVAKKFKFMVKQH